MRAFSDRTILAWLAGVLDPALARRLESELATDPELQARVEIQRARLREPTERPRWRLPPTGLPVGLDAAAQRAGTMGGPLRPGDLVLVSLQVHDPTPRQVVVLARDRAAWTVLLPSAPDEVLALEDLALDTAGRRQLYLSIAEAPAVQRRAVLLPPLDLPVDWSLAPEERWAALQALLDQGEVPAFVVEISLAEGRD